MKTTTKFAKKTRVSFVRRNDQVIKGNVIKTTIENNGTWVHIDTAVGPIKVRPSQLKRL